MEATLQKLWPDFVGEGEVVMCFYYDDYPEFYDSIIRRARKEHRCDECCGIIPVKAQYEYVCGKWGGEVSVYKTCADCVSLRGAIERIELSHGCDRSESTPPHGTLMECYKDYPELKEEFPQLFVEATQ